MKRSRVMRVDKEFKEYIEGLQRSLGIPERELTRRIAKIRPINIQKPIGQALDDLFSREGIIRIKKRRRI